MSGRPAVLISSKSRVYLLRDRDPVGLSEIRSAGISIWTVLIGRTDFDTTTSIPKPDTEFKLKYDHLSIAFNVNLRRYTEAITSLPNPNSKIAALGGLGAGRKWVVMVLNDHKELPQPFRRCRWGHLHRSVPGTGWTLTGVRISVLAERTARVSIPPEFSRNSIPSAILS